MNNRTFTKEEKLKIIKAASIKGVKVILEKYANYPVSYYSWKKKFETMGEEAFAKTDKLASLLHASFVNRERQTF